MDVSQTTSRRNFLRQLGGMVAAAQSGDWSSPLSAATASLKEVAGPITGIAVEVADTIVGSARNYVTCRTHYRPGLCDTERFSGRQFHQTQLQVELEQCYVSLLGNIFAAKNQGQDHPHLLGFLYKNLYQLNKQPDFGTLDSITNSTNLKNLEAGAELVRQLAGQVQCGNLSEEKSTLVREVFFAKRGAYFNTSNGYDDMLPCIPSYPDFDPEAAKALSPSEFVSSFKFEIQETLKSLALEMTLPTREKLQTLIATMLPEQGEILKTLLTSGFKGLTPEMLAAVKAYGKLMPRLSNHAHDYRSSVEIDKEWQALREARKARDVTMKLNPGDYCQMQLLKKMGFYGIRTFQETEFSAPAICLVERDGLFPLAGLESAHLVLASMIKGAPATAYPLARDFLFELTDAEGPTLILHPWSS